MRNTPRVLVVTLGGTIAMTDGPSGATPSGSVDVVAGADERDGGLDIVVRALGVRPGAHLDLTTIIEVAALIQEGLPGDYRGAVVVQGTDTLEETAFALDLLVGHESPVVVTGAMRHASDPGADGPANVADALVVAASSEARGLGSLVVLAGEIHAAALVSKAHTAIPGAFRSSPGPLGWVVEGRARILLRPVLRSRVVTGGVQTMGRVPQVPVLSVSMGTDPAGALFAGIDALDPAGVVVEALGGGHVPSGLVDGLTAMAQQRTVVLASRVGAGPVLRHTYGFDGSERDLRSRGLIGAGPFPTAKARVALALLLAAGADRTAIAEWFERQDAI